ncbi:MAG TPA: efflux RND transporter periplasmic adaptor subunit [Xanthobacteraceae bacterium]|nr:efflux RND transporter periplasmic adaptor subunit [Xanthobacteraceae bacterium]
MSSEAASSEAAPPSSASSVSRRALWIAGVTLATLAGFVVVMGLTTRREADAKLSEWTEAQAIPVVAVAPPDTHGKNSTFTLPGRLEAYTQAQIYARVSGYLKEWKADIGASVKAGDLLAEIDAPDLDQQIMQAQAEFAAAQANSTLAATTLQRGQQLITSGAVSKQDLDQRAADASNKQGLANSAQANLDRLRVLEKYKRITAPFDGLVTARNTDLGALINAGAAGAPLFVVSETNKLRVYVNVPQNYVPNIKIGTNAHIAVPEYVGRQFSATVEASAQAVDAASGTTRMLLVVDNASRQLMSGAYANVSFDLPHPEIAINVPASALIFDRSGMHVATVNSENRVVLKDVLIARDLGKEVEISKGLSPDDRIIQSPPDGIASGDRVRIAGAANAEGPVADAAVSTK